MIKHSEILFSSVWACGSSDHQLEHNNSYTGTSERLLSWMDQHVWVFLPNGLKCAFWGHLLVCRYSCTVCNWKVFLLNVSACASWGDQFFAGVVTLLANENDSRPFNDKSYTSIYKICVYLAIMMSRFKITTFVSPWQISCQGASEVMFLAHWICVQLPMHVFWESGGWDLKVRILFFRFDK